MPADHSNLDVLYEDNHLLAVNKPVGLPTMGVTGDRPSMLSVAKAYLREKYHKPGNVYVGIISRLDAPVSGVLVMARTSKAAARLNRSMRQREVDKVYLAVVEGEVQPPAATLSHYLRKDERHRKMHTTGRHTPGAVEAVLSYRVLRCRQGLTLVEVRPITGRKHQIRVQLAKQGHPIVGDRKYGSRLSFSAGIALHCREFGFTHPVQRVLLQILAEPPRSWHRFHIL